MHIGWLEIVLIALVVLLLFGGKKIPELMNSLGKGLRSFRDGVNGKDDEQDEVSRPIKADHNTKVDQEKE